MTARILTVLSATVFAITAIPAAAENTSPAKAAATGTPKIEFNATTYNFGKVNMGELIRHEFVFTNVGTAPLEILEVKPGCGCTTAGAWDKVVQPGKTGVIPLQFNTANYGGSVAKSTTVTCNGRAAAPSPTSIRSRRLSQVPRCSMPWAKAWPKSAPCEPASRPTPMAMTWMP